MKKQLALGAAFAIGVAMTGSAFASPVLTWSGNAKGSYELDSWTTPVGSGVGTDGGPGLAINVKAHAEETGKWTLDADLGDITGTANWGSDAKIKGVLTDPNFTLTAASGADGWELDRLNGGVGLIDTGDNQGGIEIASHGAKLELVDGNTAAAQYSMPVGSTTIGVIGKSQIGTGANGQPLVGGWASQSVGGLTLTGQVADKLGDSSGANDLAYGIKAGSDTLTPNIGAWASYTNKGAGFAGAANDDSKIDVNGTYTAAPLRVKGDYWTENNGTSTTDLNGSVTYSGSDKNQGWDDLFAGDKYYKNVALGAQAYFETKNDGSASSTNTIELKATSPVMPALWVNGDYKVVTDADGFAAGDGNNHTASSQLSDSDTTPADITVDGNTVDLASGATSNTHLGVNAYYQLNDHVNVQPLVALDQVSNGSSSVSQTTIGGDVNYGIGANGKVTAGYRNQSANLAGGATATQSKFNLGYEVDF